ncbi:MAG: phosphate ABC transporter permease subunit PstC [candidate division WOR-3 bacterium]
MRSRWMDTLVHISLLMISSITILTTIGIVGVLVFESFQFFKEVPIKDFIMDTQWTPLFAEKHFGIWPLLSGTFLTSFIAMCVSIPSGLLIAIFLSEYSTSRVRNIIKPLLEMLAGIPTVVYGYFALLTVTPFLKKFIPNLAGFNALSPGIVMGIMIIPIVSSLSEDALRSVPISLREASYALGATKFQTIFNVIIPSAFSGIMSSFILGISRALGETMIVTIAAGQKPTLTLNPLQPIETMTAYIVQVSLGDTPHGTLEYKTIFAVGFTLFIITLIFNILAYMLKRKNQNL